MNDKEPNVILDSGKFASLKNIIQEKRKMNGIDVGCGARKVFDSAIGIDIDRYVALNNISGKEAIPEWVGDGRDLPFKNCTLDYVMSSHALEHIDRINEGWKTALFEWSRCLKSGGILDIVVPDPDSSHHPGHGLKMDDVSSFLRKIGFTIKSNKTITFLDNSPYDWEIVAIK